MNQNYKISIIVPAYNVEKYIEKCLNSILNQTYKNIEVIVVNDGSTDNTLNILEEVSKTDNRVILINQKNSGVSSARNNALEKVNSDFIMFVGSDDWIDENTCEIAINEATNENADIVMFGYIREYGKKSISKATFEDDKIVFEKQDIMNKLHRKIFGPVDEELKYPEKLNAVTTIWGKLYKTNLIKNIKFVSLKETGLCEDGYFNIDAFKNCNKAIFIKKYFYHYRKVISGGSLTQKNESDIFEKEKRFYNKLYDVIKKENLSENYKIALDNRMAISLIESGITIVNSKKNIYKNIKNILYSKEYSSCCKNLKLKFLPLHWKIFFGFAKIKFTFGVYILLKIITSMASKK